MTRAVLAVGACWAMHMLAAGVGGAATLRSTSWSLALVLIPGALLWWRSVTPTCTGAVDQSPEDRHADVG
jgi:hypothetical protein